VIASALFIASCEPPHPHDSARIYGSPAASCSTKYVAAPEAAIELTVVASDEAQRDFALQGFCMTLDGGAVMLTDNLEISAHHVATRTLRTTAGSHVLRVLGAWADKDRPRDRFEVKSAHELELRSSGTVRATAYESQLTGPLQERLKIGWIETTSGGPR